MPHDWFADLKTRRRKMGSSFSPTAVLSRPRCVAHMHELAVKVPLTLLLFFCFLAGSSSVRATEAAPSRTFTIGTEDFENFKPYSEQKNGVFSGLGRAILDAFAEKQGYRFDYRTYPTKRRDRMFVAGEFDFCFPDNPYWVADLKKGIPVRYEKMLEYTDGMMVLPEHAGKDLRRVKMLGMPLGFTPYPYAESIKAGAIRVVESDTYDSLYRQLNNRMIDAAYVDIRVAGYYWSQSHNENKPTYVYDPSLPHVSDYFYLSTIKHPAVLEELRSFMNNNPVLIEKLKKEYGF